MLNLGTHDFRAFRSADDGRENTERTLWAIDFTEGYGGQDNLLAIDVRGTAFMKNMVRIIVGTLVAVGRGRLAPSDASSCTSAGASGASVRCAAARVETRCECRLAPRRERGYGRGGNVYVLTNFTLHRAQTHTP